MNSAHKYILVVATGKSNEVKYEKYNSLEK